MITKNIIYYRNINSVGGVESWMYYLSKQYKDIVIYYQNADEEQVKRLAKNIEVRKYHGGKLKCDNFFCCYNPDIIDNVNANQYYFLIHCDYEKAGIQPTVNDKFNKYIAVSKLVGESFKKITGINYELIYNPINIDIPKKKNKNKKLKLISATRLTKEKGLNRMKQLANILDRNGVEYEWVVYTNRKREAIGRNVRYEDVKLDIIEEITNSDYLVQLSDCEAYCYSVVESLMVGTPVIVTDLPVFKEIGINQENAIICNLDMNNFDIDDLKIKRKFKYTPPKSEWDKYFGQKSSYNSKEKIEVRVLKNYTDIELNKYLMRNHIEKMTRERASYLECKGLVEIL